MTTASISQKTDNQALIVKRAKLAYIAMFIGVVGLALTGILTFALGQAPMTGWVLMAHVAVAPLFAIGLACVSLTWAVYARFDNEASPQTAFSKALLWFILLSGLVVILSGVIPMLPFFGTPGQHTLYLTHRYSAIVLTAAVALHLLSFRTKK